MDRLIFFRELRANRDLLIAALLISGVFFQLIIPVLSFQPEWEGVALLLFMGALGAILCLNQGRKDPLQSDQILAVLPLSRSTLVLSRFIPVIMVLIIVLFLSLVLFLRNASSLHFALYSLWTGLGAMGVSKLLLRARFEITQIFFLSLFFVALVFLLTHQLDLSWIHNLMRFRELHGENGVSIFFMSVCLSLLTLGLEREIHRPGPMR